jgi:hypothetical protein
VSRPCRNLDNPSRKGKALESRIKELESIAEFNRKRRVMCGGIEG